VNKVNQIFGKRQNSNLQSAFYLRRFLSKNRQWLDKFIFSKAKDKVTFSNAEKKVK
jgi:hypothetical protein